MRFARRSRVEPELNLTPLIDVVFLLLIFFMVSTTFVRETRLAIDLPEADGEPPRQQVAPFEIVVTAGGGYLVNGQPLANSERATLLQALRHEVGTAVADGSERSLVIAADAAAEHRFVVRALDVAGELGLVNLSISTRQAPDDGVADGAADGVADGAVDG